MIGAQLGAGRSRDDALRYRVLASAIGVICIAPARQLEHRGLEQILDDGKAAGHVTVKRAITRGHLAFIAGGQHDGAELVGQRHQKNPSNPGLNVFFSCIFCQPAELTGQRCLERFDLRLYRKLVIAYIHARSHLAGVKP